MIDRRKKALLLLVVAACLLPALALTLIHLVQLGTQPKAGVMILLPAEGKPPAALGNAPATTGIIASVILDSPAFHAGLSAFDRILDIEGIPLTDRSRLKAFDLSVQSGQLVHYRVVSGGRERIVALRPASLLRCLHVVPELATTLVMVIVFMGVSLFVFFRRPEDLRVVLLLLSSTATAGSYLLIPIILFPPVSPLGILDYSPARFLYWSCLGLSVPLTIAMAACFLHLGLVFPKPLHLVERKPWLVRWIYALSFGLFLLAMVLIFSTGLMSGLVEHAGTWMAWAAALAGIGLGLGGARLAARRLRRDGWRETVLAHPFRALAFTGAVSLSLLALAVGLHTALRAPEWLVYVFVLPLLLLVLLSIFGAILIFPLLTCAALIAGYRQAGPEEKRQIRWPLWGFCVALVGNALLVVASLTLKYAIPSWDPWLVPVALMLGKPLYLLIPVSFAVGILKYRLMDIDLIIRQTVIYSIVSGVVLALCFLQAVGGVLLFRQLGLGGGWGTGLVALALVVLLVPLQRRVQGFVDRRFFRSRFDYPAALDALRQQAGQAEDRAGFLRRTLETVQQALRPRTLAVLLPDSSGDLFRAADTMGVPEHVARRVGLSLPPQFADRLLGGESLRPPELAAQSIVGAEKLSPAVILPLAVRQHLAGLLLVGRKYPNRALEEEDLEFLRQVAALTADGLDRLEARRQTLDLESARAIQQRFLPQSIPAAPGLAIAAHWEPSRWVGGDYYDIVDLGQGKLGMVIADVAGKGMPAALLMSNLQAAFRALATADTEPAALSARLNDILRPQMVSGKFITLFYGRYDTGTRRLAYVNAGHCPPLLFSRSGGIRRLEEGGLMLGAFANATYRQAEVLLQPGDLLVLYTDGVPEAENPAGEAFDEERLIAAFQDGGGQSPEAMVDDLLEQVREHTRGELSDDLTLMVLSVTESNTL
jgi:serine phosphatase RsbU (regulator of sigma subunit)